MISFDRHHIRARLTFWFVSALGAVLGLYLTCACFFLLRDLRSQLVRHAIQDVETVEGLLYLNPTGRLMLRDDYHNHPESKLVLERLVEVRSPGGELLFRNERLGNESLGDTLLPQEGENGYSNRHYVLADGTPVQLVSRRHLIEGSPIIIRVAYSEVPLWGQFQSDVVALLLPLPLVLALAGAGGYFVASRSLEPIQRLARKAAAIRSDLLSERLPVNAADGELADLARAFNSVLVRLEQSFEQLRRFTSDASHELRTPLAVMRSVGEVALQKNGTAESYRDVIGSMLEEANKLTRLVETLLTIARADAGRIQLTPTVFAAESLAQECVSLFEVLLEENSQSLSIETAGDLKVAGDWLLLRQALVNVVHNAIKYTPRGGGIRIRIRTAGAMVAIEVEDSGPGIPEDELTKVFDRFYRVGEDRSREVGGAGLGLAIARWTVEINGGTITSHAAETRGCVFRILLPAVALTEEGAEGSPQKIRQTVTNPVSDL